MMSMQLIQLVVIVKGIKIALWELYGFLQIHQNKLKNPYKSIANDHFQLAKEDHKKKNLTGKKSLEKMKLFF